MKKLIYLLIALFSITNSFAQNPAPFKDGIKTNKVVYTEMTTVQRDAMVIAAGDHPTIFNVTTNQKESYNGTTWVAGGFVPTTLLADYGFTDNSTNWNLAFGWGDHSLAGYLTSETSHADVVVDGDFAANGLLKRTALGVYTTITDNSANWNTAFGWGNHATANYLLNITGESIKDLSDVFTTMTPLDGQVLTFNTVNGWQSEASGAGVTDHTLLTNIGTNTHAQIDSHILDATIHFTQAAISITESQISDLNHTTDTNTQLTQEQVEDNAFDVLRFGAGVRTLISTTYDDINNQVDFVVDNNLANYDNTTSNFSTTTGTVTAVNGGTGITSTGGVSPTLNLDNTTVVAGAYTNSNVTVDAQGRITTIANGAGGGGDDVSTFAEKTGALIGTDRIVGLSGITDFSETISGIPLSIFNDDLTHTTDTNTTDHTLLSNIGTNTHAQIDTHIATPNHTVDTNTQLTDEQVQDKVGAMVTTTNTETLINVTYQDVTGDIDFVVDNNLANYSNATSNFSVGAHTTDTNTQLAIATVGEVNTGTDNTKAISPLSLAGSQLQTDVTNNNAKISYTDAAAVALNTAKISADVFTGTGVALDLGFPVGAFYNMSLANGGLVYTVSNLTTGGFASSLINTVTKPTVTGATEVAGSTWITATEMQLVVWTDDGVNAKWMIFNPNEVIGGSGDVTITNDGDGYFKSGIEGTDLITNIGSFLITGSRLQIKDSDSSIALQSNIVTFSENAATAGIVTMDMTGITASRAINFPDNNGTLALTSDITAATSLQAVTDNGSITNNSIELTGNNFMRVRTSPTGFQFAEVLPTGFRSRNFFTSEHSTLYGEGEIVFGGSGQTVTLDGQWTTNIGNIFIRLPTIGGVLAHSVNGIEAAGDGNITVPITGLERLTETTTGFRLIGKDPLNYGNIGTESIDLSHSPSASTTMGALGDYNFVAGESNSIQRGVVNGSWGSYILGSGNTISGNNVANSGALGGFNTITNGWGVTAIGGYNTISTGDNGFGAAIGMNNLLTGTAPSGAFGTALIAKSRHTLAVGVANVNYTEIGNETTRPIFVVGNGTTTTPAGAWVAAIRSDALRVNWDGTITAPSFSNAEITTAGATALITKDYGDTNYLGGGGNVSTSGTPLVNQIPIFTNANTVIGSMGFTFNDTNKTLHFGLNSSDTAIFDFGGSETITYSDASVDFTFSTTIISPEIIDSNGTTSSVGTALNLKDNITGTLYNVATPSAATTFTTNSLKTGGYAVSYINTTSQPTVTGATLRSGATWVTGTNMKMVVGTDDGTNVYYFFLKL